MKLTRSEALEILDGDRGKIITNDITDHTRWSVIHSIVISLDGKYYSTTYSTGATESQDESPWEYKEKVEFTEVEPKEVTVILYVPVKEKIDVISE